MPDAFAQCEALVREADKDRFLAALFAPADRRPALHALYAFRVEIERIRDAVTQPLTGELRLQWWRDALANPDGADARGHPVAAALSETVTRYGLSSDALNGLIDAHDFDLYDEPMASFADLAQHIRRTSSASLELAARILGVSDVAAHAQAGGLASACAALLMRLSVPRWRRYVPLDVLAKHGARAEDVLAGRVASGVEAAFADLRDRVRGALHDYEALGPVAAKAAPAFLIVPLARLFLDRFDPRNPFAPARVPQWRRQWTLWRAARRAG